MSILKLLFGSKNTASQAIQHLNVNEFKAAIMDKKVQLIDVRTAGEFASGALKKAINIDIFSTATFEKECEKLHKESPVYVYCRSGARSSKAAKKLVKMGFSSVVNLKGGYSAWR